MSEGQSPDRLTPEDLLPPPEATGPVGPREKRARDMATMVALLGLVLVAGGLMAILALVFNQLLIFAFLAAIVLGGGYLSFHYVVWGRRLDRQLAMRSDPARGSLETAPQIPLSQGDATTADVLVQPGTPPESSHTAS